MISIERSTAEDHLRHSEGKFRTLITNIPDVTWTTDSDAQTTFISSVIKQVYGFSPKEIYQSAHELWFQRIHPEDVERVLHAFDLFFATLSRHVRSFTRSRSLKNSGLFRS